MEDKKPPLKFRETEGQKNRLSQIYIDLDRGDEQLKFSDIFQYIEYVGSGAFGKVVRAIDLRNGSQCAVKIITKKNVRKDDCQRVQREANILSSLNDPNIVKFFDVIETETQMLIQMQYVRGGTLKKLMEQKLQNNEWFTDADISKIMKSILTAVGYMHDKNIVHRDLQPENILIEDESDYSTIKIADFGLSVAYDLTNGLNSTQAGGTMLFMAPQFFSTQIYSKSIDIWSTAIIMYLLLSQNKHPLYDKQIDNATTFKSKVVQPVWTFSKEFSEIAQNLFLQLTQLNPSQRYTASQALQHPWITQKFEEIIPLTMTQMVSSVSQLSSLGSIFKAVFFLKYLQQHKVSSPQRNQYSIKISNHQDSMKKQKYFRQLEIQRKSQLSDSIRIEDQICDQKTYDTLDSFTSSKNLVHLILSPVLLVDDEFVEKKQELQKHTPIIRQKSEMRELISSSSTMERFSPNQLSPVLKSEQLHTHSGEENYISGNGMFDYNSSIKNDLTNDRKIISAKIVQNNLQISSFDRHSYLRTQNKSKTSFYQKYSPQRLRNLKQIQESEEDNTQLIRLNTLEVENSVQEDKMYKINNQEISPQKQRSALRISAPRSVVMQRKRMGYDNPVAFLNNSQNIGRNQSNLNEKRTSKLSDLGMSNLSQTVANNAVLHSNQSAIFNSNSPVKRKKKNSFQIYSSISIMTAPGDENANFEGGKSEYKLLNREEIIQQDIIAAGASVVSGREVLQNYNNRAQQRIIIKDGENLQREDKTATFSSRIQSNNSFLPIIQTESSSSMNCSSATNQIIRPNSLDNITNTNSQNIQKQSFEIIQNNFIRSSLLVTATADSNKNNKLSNNN